ncbi:MAG: hypothetical protein H0W86_02380 [Armatimonadetes bacterium]|nr:hypothetical protein [Armatimonadota bacterium]
MNRQFAPLLLAVLFLPASARSDEEASPYDYIRPVKGGRYIFVMLRPARGRQYAYSYEVYADASSCKSSSKDGLLFKKYPASGLYRKGSTKPLWTVSWYSFDVRVCSDGVHLVRFGPWPRSGDDRKTLALGFFRSGKEVRSYAVRDLVADQQSLPQSFSHYEWMKSSSFDDAGKRLKVELLKGYDYGRGQSLIFDIPTGEKRVAK